MLFFGISYPPGRLAGGLERIWIEFDVNRNVFGVKMPPDAPRYSPEFVIVGEKISL